MPRVWSATDPSTPWTFAVSKLDSYVSPRQTAFHSRLRAQPAPQTPDFPTRVQCVQSSTFGFSRQSVCRLQLGGLEKKKYPLLPSCCFSATDLYLRRDVYHNRPLFVFSSIAGRGLQLGGSAKKTILSLFRRVLFGQTVSDRPGSLAPLRPHSRSLWGQV